MEYAAVEARVREILAEKFNVEPSRVRPESKLVEDLGMDSFTAIEMAFELEEKFNLKIPEDEIRKVANIKDVVDCIAKCVP